jgi:hypothetical protein
MKKLFLTVLIAVMASGLAIAQAQRVNVRGTIVALDGNVLSVDAAGTISKIALADNLNVNLVVKSDLAKIAVGTFVGTAALPQPDGMLRAQEVLIFPEAMRGRGEGFRPWDLTPQSTMTNATVDSIVPRKVDRVDGRLLTLKYKEGEKQVFVPANVPIVTFEPGDRGMLVPGAHVVIIGATKRDDGLLAAAGVNVGKDGLTPPM